MKNQRKSIKSVSKTSDCQTVSKKSISKVYKKSAEKFPATTSNLTSAQKNDTQYYQNLIFLNQNDPTKYKEYNYCLYKDVLYHSGDNIIVKNKEGQDNVCSITKIFKIWLNDDVLVLFEVQWFYNRTFLHKIYKDFFDFIGENELFLPNNYHRDIVHITMVQGICQVISQEKYETLQTIPNNVYFYRAKYDIYSKKLQPPPENWPKYCICELPWCPNLAYIQCDACLKWFHLECVNINENIITEIENYVCSKCQKSIQ